MRNNWDGLLISIINEPTQSKSVDAIQIQQRIGPRRINPWIED